MGKQCTDCGAGHKNTNKRCGSCHYEFYRVSKLNTKYGLSAESYDEMYESQGGCCAICGVHESKLAKRLHVDHCHDTGKIRGLLCRRCNTYIAHFEKEPKRLLTAYAYLGGE